MAEVLVVGAGPVGTLLAAELARFGVDAAVLERRPTAGGGSRAIGLHAPTLAALEAGGATDRILTRAVRVRRGEARSGAVAWSSNVSDTSISPTPISAVPTPDVTVVPRRRRP